MSINIADNMGYNGKKPLDNRVAYSTLALMKAVTDANIYEGCEAYCAETDKYYKFLSSNTVDETTGKWRERATGGGGSSSSYVYNSATDLSTTIGGTQTVTLSNLTRSDDSTVNPTVSDIAIGKTIISDTAGTIGVATAIASSNVTVSTISIAGSSGGSSGGGSVFKFTCVGDDVEGKTVTITDTDSNTFTGTFDANNTCVINGVTSVGVLTITSNAPLTVTTTQEVVNYSLYRPSLQSQTELSYTDAYAKANASVSHGDVEYVGTIRHYQGGAGYYMQYSNSTSTPIGDLNVNSNMTENRNSDVYLFNNQLHLTHSSNTTLTFAKAGIVVVGSYNDNSTNMGQMTSQKFDVLVVSAGGTVTLPYKSNSVTDWVSYYPLVAS